MRKLLFILFFFFCTPSFAVDYYWTHTSTGVGVHYDSAEQACLQGYGSGSCPAYRQMQALSIDGTSFQCQVRVGCKADGSWAAAGRVGRSGDSCPEGTSFNVTKGSCDPNPQECEAGNKLMTAVNCSLIAGSYVTPGEVCVDGCVYVPNPDGRFKPYPNYDDPSATFCVATYAGTGQNCAGGDPDVPDIPPDQAAPPPEDNPNPEDPSCVSYGPNTFCADPQQPNCGTLNGQPYCNGESDKCGTVNGQFMCIPKSGSKECTYANGRYVCINPETDEIISDTSPDHPNNGGNADGNPNNDPTQNNGGTSGGGAGASQGINDPATNKAVGDLKDAVTDGFSGLTDLLKKDTPSGESLKPPTEKGTFDLEEWDGKIAAAKSELKDTGNAIVGKINSVNSWFISGGGGSLPCITTDVARICPDDYSDELVGIRYVLLFIAALIAVFIVFIKE